MTYETKILDRREIAQGTYEVSFARPDGYTFKAGQYAQIRLPQLTVPDAKGSSRLFSIASPASDTKVVRIVFRHSGSGFKTTLLESKDTTVLIESPAGNLVLPSQPQRPLVFVAGGVGISPFMSCLFDAVSKPWAFPIALYYGNQNPQSAAYVQELKTMTKQQKRFTLHEMYKRPKPQLFASLAKKHPEALLVVVGPPGMVANCTAGLIGAGITNTDILTESFEGY